MKRALLTSLIISFAAAIDADSAAPAILTAIAANDTTQVQSLLARGADVDTRDPNGNTGLMIAAAYGYTDIARLLVEAGADVDARGRIGNTPLIYAVQQGQTEIVRLLIAGGALVDARNEFGSNPRDLATGLGHRDIAEIFNNHSESNPEVPAPQLLAAVHR